MQDVHVARTLADAYMIRDVLQQEGIPAAIRNEHLVGAEGGLPINESRPRVSVSEADVQRARFVLAEYLRDDDAGAALVDMERDAPATGDDEAAAEIITELRVAAAALARGRRRGEHIDTVERLGRRARASAPPFGIPAKTWELVGRLAADLVDAAGADDEPTLQQRAGELAAALGPYAA